MKWNEILTKTSWTLLDFQTVCICASNAWIVPEELSFEAAELPAAADDQGQTDDAEQDWASPDPDVVVQLLGPAASDLNNKNHFCIHRCTQRGWGFFAGIKCEPLMQIFWQTSMDPPGILAKFELPPPSGFSTVYVRLWLYCFAENLLIISNNYCAIQVSYSSLLPKTFLVS
jgi:hypothetical protein